MKTQETPNYYNWHPSGECYKISQEFNSNLGQAIQYIWRSGCPGNTKYDYVVEDLEKAIRFIQYEIERLQTNALEEQANSFWEEEKESDFPESYKYWAMDINGDAYFFTHKPVLNEFYWAMTEGDILFDKRYPQADDYKDSLKCRN